MRSPTRYKFRHYRPDEDGQSKMIWASDGPGHSEERNDGIVKGSIEDSDILRSQLWTPNELANEGEIALLEAYFGTGNGPASLFFRLWATTLVDTSTEATGTEVTGTGYPGGAAVTLTKDTDWGAVTAGPGGTTSVTKTFTGGAGGWDAAVDLALCTTGTGTAGLMIAFAALSATRTLLENDTLDVTMQVALD